MMAMTWTDVKPTGLGWYWWGDYGIHAIVEIRFVDRIGRLAFFTNGRREAIEGMEGQWSDAPIPEPEGE
jgi:hypothetical protein